MNYCKFNSIYDHVATVVIFHVVLFAVLRMSTDMEDKDEYVEIVFHQLWRIKEEATRIVFLQNPLKYSFSKQIPTKRARPQRQ